MPCENIMLVPAFSIEYDLEVRKDGVVTHEKRIGNIGYRIVPDVYEGYVSYVRYYSKTITDAYFHELQDFDPIVVVNYVKEK